MDYLQFGEGGGGGGGGGGVGRNDVQPGTIVAFSLLQTHMLNIICTYQPQC